MRLRYPCVRIHVGSDALRTLGTQHGADVRLSIANSARTRPDWRQPMASSMQRSLSPASPRE